MRLKIYTLFIFFSSFYSIAAAQEKAMDSLKLLLKTARHDTIKVSLLNQMISLEYDDKVWPIYNDRIDSIARVNLLKNPTGRTRDMFEEYLAYALSNKGYLLKIKDQNSAAMKCFLESAAIQKRINDKQGFATSMSCLAYTYNDLGDIPKAIEYNFKVLKLREELGDKDGMALNHNNLGLIFESQGQHSKALESINKGLQLCLSTGNKRGVSTSYNNLGFVYSSMKKYDEALQNYSRSLKIAEQLKDTSDIGLAYANMALVYKSLEQPKIALEYLNKSLAIARRLDQTKMIARQLHNIGFTYYDLGQTAKAYQYANESFPISKKLGYPEDIKNAANLLYLIHKKTGNTGKALEMYELFIKMRDSLTNENIRKSAIQNQFQYTYDKKAAEDSIKNAEEKKVSDARIEAQTAQLRQEKTQRFALFGGLALLIAFSVFFYNRFRITQKQKHIIEKQKLLVDEKNEELNQQNEEIAAQRDEIENQKELIEEKQKEVTDSILYARRIQRALLASNKLLKENLTNHFIFFQPKDIVSGDFYWATKANNKFYFVIADSTGHGVPGAFMSLLNISFLNEAITEKHIYTPAEILNYVRTRLMVALQDDGSEEGGKDGMDCILLAFDQVNKTLDFACANNALQLIRNNELITFAADRMPVGRSPRQDESFTNQSLKLEKGDCIYAYTDGYADQFGGPKGKKFKYKPLEDLLLKTNEFSSEEQIQILKNTIEDWKGRLEQVDDILIVGIRI